MPSHSTTSRLQFVAICACGCGQPTLLAVKTYTRFGVTKGQPLRLLHLHSPRGVAHKGYTYRVVSKQGYIKIYSPKHPYAACNGYVFEHRLVVEAEIGRYLLPTELIHHKNRNGLDNRLENLEIVTRSQHGKIHGGEKKMTGWSMKHDACISCGTTEQKHYGLGLCQHCYNQRRWKNRSRCGIVNPTST